MKGRDILFQPVEFIASSGNAIRGSFHGTRRPGDPCIIFCHGFTGQRCGPGYIFVKISRALAEAGFSSIRFDFTGAGESEGFFSEMNTATMLSDLTTVVECVREQFAPSQLILCGHSFGGMVAARSAAVCGASGLVLLSPVGDPTGLIRRRKALLEAGPNPSGFYENGPHEMSLSFLDSLQGFDPVEEFGILFTGALLLVQGDHDLSISVDESYRYVAAAEGKGLSATYHLLQGSDHNYSRVTDVVMVVTAIVSWVKEHFGE